MNWYTNFAVTVVEGFYRTDGSVGWLPFILEVPETHRVVFLEAFAEVNDLIEVVMEDVDLGVIEFRISPKYPTPEMQQALARLNPNGGRTRHGKSIAQRNMRKAERRWKQAEQRRSLRMDPHEDVKAKLDQFHKRKLAEREEVKAVYERAKALNELESEQ